MECKEFAGLIPDFLHNALDDAQLYEFFDHVDECENCRDELRIQYLIYEGLERLETGATFDVDKDLADLMDEERMRLCNRTAIKKAAIAAEIMTVAAFVIVLGAIMFY